MVNISKSQLVECVTIQSNVCLTLHPGWDIVEANSWPGKTKGPLIQCRIYMSGHQECSSVAPQKHQDGAPQPLLDWLWDPYQDADHSVPEISNEDIHQDQNPHKDSNARDYTSLGLPLCSFPHSLPMLPLYELAPDKTWGKVDVRIFMPHLFSFPASGIIKPARIIQPLSLLFDWVVTSSTSPGLSWLTSSFWIIMWCFKKDWTLFEGHILIFQG